MIYTHVLSKGDRGVRSPVDGLQAGLYRLYNSEWVIGEKMQKKLDAKVVTMSDKKTR